ncbi:MAG: hypothetical protein KHX24_04120 [Clostridiales bacterium]|nr:hypothetical protein [Clostridiales bacterium]
MKRIISALLITVLIISMAGCNNQSGSENGGANSSSPVNNTESSKPFDYSVFVSDFSNNELRAKEDYIGNVYTVSAFVRSVKEDSCILEILDAVADDFVFKAMLPKEDLMALNNSQRITVSGTIEQIEGRQIVLNDASYIDGTSEITATVLSLVYASASDATPSYCTARISGSIDGTSGPLCNIYLSGDELSGLTEDEEIAVNGTLYAMSTNPLEGGVHEHYGETILLEMKDAQLTNTQ